MSELREAIARAMAEANGEPEHWEAWLIDADAALASIEARGMVVVPLKPTPAMVRAREPDDRFNSPMLDEGEYWFRNSKSAGAFASKLWRAMIAAARDEGKST